MLRYALIACLVGTALCAPSAHQEHQPSMLEEVYDIYASCSGQDTVVCLKMKALGYVDRVARSAEINLVDGIKIVKSEEAKASSRADNARSLNDIEASLPAEGEAREAAVDEAIVDRTARFLSTHTIEVSNPEESSRAMTEGRKKKKGLKAFLPLLFLLKLKLLAIVPILIGGLALLALKALVAGKIALIISGILALQKLLHGGGLKPQTYEVHPLTHDDHHEHHGWQRAYAAQLSSQ